MTITKSWKVYGIEGHRQRQSFGKTEFYDFSTADQVREITIVREDLTETNDYAIITITRNTAAECDAELAGQISDGLFENCRVGMIEECDGPESFEGLPLLAYWEQYANAMDDEIREAVCADLGPTSEAVFYLEYCRRHREKFGEEFTII